MSVMEQRSEEWFAARKGRVTASMAGALLGMSPNMSEASAFRALVRSINNLDDEFKGNIATQYGTNNEPGARVEYEMETGNTVQDVGFIAIGGWLGASPDGLVGDDGLVEIKCPFNQRDANPPQFKSAEDQPHYYMQMQLQMFCTGREWCDFFQWSQHGTRIERVIYDAEWTLERISELAKIWQKAMDVDPALYDGPLRKEIDTPEAARLMREYDDLCEAIDRATERKKEVLGEITALAGGNDSIIAGHLVTKVHRAGSVSYAKALKHYAPDADLEPFRGKPTEFWKVT